MAYLLDEDERRELFIAAREINPSVGNLFQNPMEITAEMVDLESNELDVVEAKIARMRSHLLMIRRKTL